MNKHWDIFGIKNDNEFTEIALQIFRFQANNNSVYSRFIKFLNLDIQKVKKLEDIPFLPIHFFKDYQVTTSSEPFDAMFKSSGTTGTTRSRHYVKSLEFYEESFSRAFSYYYGDISQYTLLALLPSYVAQGDSSLVYMTQKLIEKTQHKDSGFYLHNHDALAKILQELDTHNQKTLLIGVSYALLDLVDKYNFNLRHTIIMETGGMKGRRKEMIREELHERLKKGFGVENIHSEYGMTELLSQSYSKGNGIFQSPPWQKILIRETEDPFTYLSEGKTGGINVIDLANIYSCSFIATQDLGKKTGNTFEISGRFDHSDVRGCNLLVMN